jgi:hypothetical protein
MSEANIFSQPFPEAQVPPRVAPNSADCRAKPSGFGDYVDCMVDACKRCRYALEFGSSALCRHPLRHQIALRTKTSPASVRIDLNAAG